MCIRARQWRYGLTLALIVLGLTVTAAFSQRAAGQEPGYPGAVPKKLTPIYTNKRVFNLPVKLHKDMRANLSEMQLYYKTGRSDWQCYTKIQPHEERFVFKADHDGEFFFTVVTVDRSGKMLPPDVRLVPPGLQVIIDTRPPVLEVKATRTENGEIFIKCEMIDDNPDPGSMRLFCRTGGGEGFEQPVPCVQGQPGLFRLAPKMGQPVRVEGNDRCNNLASQEVHLHKLLAGQNPPASAPPRPELKDPVVSPTVKGDPFNPTLKPGVSPLDTDPFSANPTPPAGNDSSRLVANEKNFLDAPDPRTPMPIAAGPLPSFPDKQQRPQQQQPMWQSPVQPNNVVTVSEHAPTIPPVPGMGMGPMGAISVSTATPANRKIINTTLASVDYRVEQHSRSGISKVQVYMTGDQGASWQILKEDSDKHNPIDVRLPGEGLFGLSVVLTNGNGFGGTPPRSGDNPSFWIEVDTTPPTVQLHHTDQAAGSGALEIRWNASDKNLAADPINLYFRTRQDSPWQPIAHRLKNDGQFRWMFPRNNDGQFYFRVEAIDQAGNVGRAESTSPVLLDMTEPRAVVTNVTGSSSQQRAGGFPGN